MEWCKKNTSFKPAFQTKPSADARSTITEVLLDSKIVGSAVSHNKSNSKFLAMIDALCKLSPKEFNVGMWEDPTKQQENQKKEDQKEADNKDDSMGPIHIDDTAKIIKLTGNMDPVTVLKNYCVTNGQTPTYSSQREEDKTVITVLAFGKTSTGKAKQRTQAKQQAALNVLRLLFPKAKTWDGLVGSLHKTNEVNWSVLSDLAQELLAVHDKVKDEDQLQTKKRRM
eukprot:TRINITY_DN4224_c0_g1_i2.p1 TRINITY_DN4224_c0_g1~~TRINITY_DN4224_c0_g1_i2.p1  ORF type:complete len:226 (+),score=44.67 TRINITY_DN4224_c0_g1_i2:493-1170(+)